MFDAIHAYKTI